MVDWFEAVAMFGVARCWRAGMVEAGWRIVQPVLDGWAAAKPADFPNYTAGSSGPKAADELLARDGARSCRPIGNPIRGGAAR